MHGERADKLTRGTICKRDFLADLETWCRDVTFVRQVRLIDAMRRSLSSSCFGETSHFFQVIWETRLIVHLLLMDE